MATRSLPEHSNRVPTMLGVALLAGLVLRLTWLWAYSGGVIVNESADYVRIAERLLQGGSYEGIFGGYPLQPPLYSLLVAAVALLTGSVETAGQAVSLTAGVLLVVPMFLITTRLFGTRAGLVAAALTAMHPAFIALSGVILSEGLYFTIFFYALWSLFRLADRPSYRTAVVTGVLFGLAYLTRPEALYFAGLLSLVVAGWIHNERRSWKLAAGVWALTVGAAALVALPYIVHLSSSSGFLRLEGKSNYINLINKKMMAGSRYSAAANELGQDGAPDGPTLWFDRQLDLPRSGVRDTVTAVVTGQPQRLRQLAAGLVKDSQLGWPLLAFMAVVGVLRCRRIGIHHVVMLIAGAGIFASLLAVWFYFDRYTLIFVPFLVVAAAAGIDLAASGISKLAGPRLAPGAVHALACTLLAVASLAPAVHPVLEDAEFAQTRTTFVRTVGTWIASSRAATGAPPRIMSVGSTIPFYAGGVLLSLPYADSRAALSYIEKRQPDFIVLRTDERQFRPYIAQWLRDGIPHSCAALARQFQVGSSDLVAVYTWDCEPRQAARQAPR